MRDALRALYARLITAGAVLATVLVIGATGYHQLGGGRWSWGDCLYMTVITLSTVGYGEVLPGMDQIAFTRVWTVGLIVLGSGTLLYFVSTLTAIIVEGDLRGILRRNRMQQRIDRLEGHIIVCGVGTTGIHVIEELRTIGTPFVVVDMDGDRLARLMDEGYSSLLYVVGDAAEDHVLEHAGIMRARGVVAALHDDRSNLFVTLTARALNPKLRIVAKAVEHGAGPKILRAGADAFVSPNYIGGLRLVSEMVRPRVVQFLDQMLRDKDKNLRIDEITIPDGSLLAGRALRDSELRKHGDVLVIAIRDVEGKYVYNPSAATTLEPGMTLIVLAKAAELGPLRELVTGVPG